MQVIDMHCDTIIRMLESTDAGKSAHLDKNDFSIDIEKLKAGHYMLQNFAIFTPLKMVDNPVLHCQRGIDYYYQEIEKNKEYIHPVLSYQDIENNVSHGMISAMLTLEEGAVVFNDLAMLRNYYRLGVRMITLTWNFANGIGYPNFESSPTNTFKDLFTLNTMDGLTPFGIEYVKEMERLGIIIDVSHLSDAGFYDVLKHTTKPFVASHSNARSVCGVARNMSDEMICALANRGGVMGINYCGDFLASSDTGGEKSMVVDMVKHIQHIVSVGGVDCVGLGSDFDGISPNLEMEDASKLPMLETALQQAGFSQEDIAKIFYQNVLRVYKEVLK